MKNVGRVMLIILTLGVLQFAVASCAISESFGLGDSTNCKVQASFVNGKAVYGIVCDSQVDLFENSGVFSNTKENIGFDRSYRQGDVNAFSTSYFDGVRVEPVQSYDVDSNDEILPDKQFIDFTVFKERVPTFVLDSTSRVGSGHSSREPPNKQRARIR